MSTYDYRPGLGNAASYEVSGIPYARGAINASTTTQIKFPSVTRWVVICNNPGNGNLKIGFSQEGVENGASFIELPGESVSPRLELKVTELWISGSSNVGIMAGLTYIDLQQINNPSVSPSGSNWSGSHIAVVG
jgi:hypothetical protein